MIEEFIGVFLAVLIASTLGTFIAYQMIKIMLRRDFGVDLGELMKIVKQYLKRGGR